MKHRRPLSEIFRVNQNVRNIFIYFFSSGLSRSIPFLLLPLLTRLLSPSDFGILGLTTVYVAMITPLISVNSPAYIYAHYFKFSVGELNHQVAIISSLAVFLACVLGAGAVLFYYLNILGNTLPLWTILAIIVISFSMSMFNMAQTLNQIETRIKRYVVYELSNALIIGTMVAVLVLMLGLKWEGRFLAGFAGNVVVGTAALIYLIRSRSLAPAMDSSKLKAFLGFSVPTLPHILGIWALNGIARLFLARYVSLDEAGYFQVAFQLSMILILFYDAMFKVWNPFFYRHLALIEERPRVKFKLVKYSYLYVLSVLALAGGFLLVSQILIHVFVYEKFARSAVYLIWLVLGKASINVTRTFTGYLYHTGKTKILAVATALSALINIPLAFLMNHLNGPVGVAQATFMAFALHSLLITSFAMKTFPMPWLYPLRFKKDAAP